MPGRGIIARTHVANTPEILTGATALTATENRGRWSIQNVGTNPIFVLLGADASTTVFHKILKGGTDDSDGLGADWGHTDGVVYSGVITVAGTAPKYVVTEL